MTYRFTRPNNYKYLKTICKDLNQAKAFVKYFYRAYKIKLHVSVKKED